jgi:Raf kinase inhibitor-like YbhB/YbcL family protein
MKSFILVIFLSLFVLGLSKGVEKIKVYSYSFKEGDFIPTQYTCDGLDISPHISWSKVENAKSYAIIMDDPDAPIGTFTHWIVYDIPSNVLELKENFPKKSVVGNIKQGQNDFGKIGYGGPCPPRGKPHRYFFKVFALDVESLGLPAGLSREEVERFINKHTISSGFTYGLYKR